MIQLPDKALIGMVHLPALPGSAAQTLPLSEIIDRATGEAAMLADAGFDAVIVENFGDAPFQATTMSPHTVAVMTRCVCAVVAACGLPVSVGISILSGNWIPPIRRYMIY